MAMFCAIEDIGRGLQRFCWPPPPPPPSVVTFPVSFDHRNVIPTLMLPSIGLQSPSKSYGLQQQQLQQQQLSGSFTTTPFQQYSDRLAIPPISPARNSTALVHLSNTTDFRGLHRRVDDDEVDIRRSVDRVRSRHVNYGNCDTLVVGKEDTGNGNRCTRRRGQTMTSFTIADILEGRVGSEDGYNKRRRVDQSASPSDRVLLSVPTEASTRRTPSSGGSELVRPWNQTDASKSGRVHADDLVSRRSSSSSVESCSPEATNNEDYDDEENDDDDEDNEDIDVDDDDVVSEAKKNSSLMDDSPLSACPLGALLRMTSQTNFSTSPGNGLQDCLAAFDDSGSDGNCSSYDTHHVSRRSLFPVSAAIADPKCFRSCRKRRKTRTAFTNQQIAELERWFGRQKYLTPADRDEIAAALRLSAAQVITWFQNRRAKLKRDLEELKADVAAAKALGTEPSTAVLDRLAELTRASGLQLQQQPVTTTSLTTKKTDNCRTTPNDNLVC